MVLKRRPVVIERWIKTPTVCGESTNGFFSFPQRTKAIEQ